MHSKLSVNSLCVHAGTRQSAEGHGVNTPIHTSTANVFRGSGEIYYPRYFNAVNQEAVVEKICALEKAEDGLVFSSGMAAITTAIFGVAKKGDHIIFQHDIYGGTHYFAASRLEQMGLEYTFVKSMQAADYEKAIRPNTKLIYIETPNNPLLKIIDIAAVSAIAKKHGILTMIDNTFASPINQNPIPLGVDIVMHSGTKYLGGHSDICCGALTSSKVIMAKIRDAAKLFGGNLDAQTCALLERSIKTLSVRVERQNTNAMTIAKKLEKNASITKLHYPGLESHESHAIAKKQMSGFGGMLAFELIKKIDPIVFMDKLKLIVPAVSLGGVESTCTLPTKTSHAKLSPAEREEAGISEQLVRLSVGIEDAGDLIADMEQALS